MTRAQIWTLIRKYRFNSIFFSYLRYTLVLMIIPFAVVTIFMTQSTYNNAQSEAKRKNIQAHERSRYILDNTFENLNNIYTQLASDNEITCLLSTDTSTMAPFVLHKSVSKFYSFSRNIIVSNSMFNSIFLYSKKNGYVHSSDGSNTLESFFNLDWYNAYLKNDGGNTICTSVIDNEQIISVVMNIYKGLPSEGVIVLNLRKSSLDSYSKSFKESDFQFYTFFISDSGEPFYSFGGKSFEEVSKNASFSYTHKISDYSAVCKGFLICNLTALTLKRILPIAFSYFILFVLAIVLVAFLCSLKSYKSIANIVTSFENAAFGKSEEGEGYNELHYINDNIMNILLHSKALENDLVTRFSELKKAQSIALQSQMNPHFLFNTLNLVNTIIIEDSGGDTEAVNVVKKLAELISLSLDTKNYIVSVDAELRYAKKYIDIELIRSDYAFSIKWGISPEVLHCSTLKMILQPILENAIFYGIGNTLDDEAGKIIVRAFKEDNKLVFTVTDNGMGIDPDRLDEIEKKLDSDEIIESKHIGLANVSSRIRLIYGKEYGCKIKTSSKGTQITITQPLS